MKTVIGLFSHSKQIANTIDALVDTGANAEQISLITSDSIDKDSFEITSNTKVPETAGIGAIAGGTAGLILGGLAAIGTVTTGGIGLLASGPIVASLTGGTLGAYGGGMLGAVLGLAVPDTEYQGIIDEIEKGGVLVCVECQSDQVSPFTELLKTHNAKHIETASPAKMEKIKGL